MNFELDGVLIFLDGDEKVFYFVYYVLLKVNVVMSFMLVMIDDGVVY